MDQTLKRALAEAYRAPAPARKAAFLKRHRRRELGRRELVAVQAGYIRWWIWAASLALFAVILLAAHQPEGHGLWAAAALIPFLALLLVTENGRSRLHRMDELELACRLPRQSVLLARMVVLGLFHLALLAGLTPALAVWDAVGAVRAAAHLLTPYLLTAALGMELTRRVRGRECLPACAGAAVLVSTAGILMECQRPALYQQSSLLPWGLALVAAGTATAVEIKLSLNGTEEVQWN